MREISEYKLLGYLLIGLYEKTGNSDLKYEKAKELISMSTKSVDSFETLYQLSTINSKMDILNDMMRKNVFNITKVNDKITFTQKNYEVSKFIQACYSNDKVLTFKVSSNVKNSDSNDINIYKTMYVNNMSLDLRKALDQQLNSYISKTASAKKRYQ